MSRHTGTTVTGKPFDAKTIETVWNKAPESAEHRPMRVDAYGTLIWKEGYGSTASRFGWEIDHIKPVALGGGDEIENLQALQWENNRRKGDTWSGESKNPVNGQDKEPAVTTRERSV